MIRQQVSWRIWYDDGSTFSSDQGSWAQIPVDGVLIVMEYFDDGKKLVHMGSDYYLMREDTVIDFSIAHLDRHLRLGVPEGSIKFGRWTTDERWKWAHREAFGVYP